MVDYLSFVSTDLKEGKPIANGDRRRHIRRVRYDLRQRTRTMAVLHRESIPKLPYLLDVPRHLACISSLVVRNSKESTAGAARLGDDVDIAVDEFCARCFEVEAEALSRLNRIVTKAKSGLTDAHLSIPDLPRQRSGEAFASSRSYGASIISSQGQGHKRPDTRPATAPGLEIRRQVSRNEDDQYISADKSLPVPKYQGQHQHPKSPSTDSLPKLLRDTRTLQPATLTEGEDDTGKRKKGLFRGILKR